jgi:hypothetical protein
MWSHRQSSYKPGFILLLVLHLCESFQAPGRRGGTCLEIATTEQQEELRRRLLIIDRKNFVALLCLGTAGAIVAVPAAHAKSYSANARNMERMSAGDMSGGGVYDNNPASEAGRKRRAMTGCKNAVAREEASESVLQIETTISEKECNLKVLSGDSEFMLQALRNLDCPTCPYGIATSRN